MLLMFCLGRPDVLPVGDYGVRKAMQRLYRMRELPKPARMEKVASPWRPYRTIASWYLWRSLEIVTPGK
jgi:DNA-3-methyladenine glycosylase II